MRRGIGARGFDPMLRLKLLGMPARRQNEGLRRGRHLQRHAPDVLGRLGELDRRRQAGGIREVRPVEIEDLEADERKHEDEAGDVHRHRQSLAGAPTPHERRIPIMPGESKRGSDGMF
jgi:hypothetical protein